MLGHLALEREDWKPASTPILRNIAVLDLDDVLKAWKYFFYHTNRSGSKLITMKALALFLLLTRQPMNIGHIIYVDMDEMAQSMTKKSLGQASMIILLCRKIGD